MAKVTVELNKLKNVLRECANANRRYEKAAKLAQSSSLINYFDRRAKERNLFAESLHSEIATYYGGAVNVSTILGILHSNLMKFKCFFSGNTDRTLLLEVFKAEQKMLNKYEFILNTYNFPMGIEATLTNQKMRIQVDLNKIESLRDLKKS